jgi:hypothetical protein
LNDFATAFSQLPLIFSIWGFGPGFAFGLAALGFWVAIYSLALSIDTKLRSFADGAPTAIDTRLAQKFADCIIMSGIVREQFRYRILEVDFECVVLPLPCALDWNHTCDDVRARDRIGETKARASNRPFKMT